MCKRESAIDRGGEDRLALRSDGLVIRFSGSVSGTPLANSIQRRLSRVAHEPFATAREHKFGIARTGAI